ncbi:MAG: hypothetical protein ACRCZF_24775 [Gemmataceae bacterium]
MWYRVFGATAAACAPSHIAAALAAAGLPIQPHFRGDDLGWTTGQLLWPPEPPIDLARYLTKEDDLRADLNAYAAELETMNYHPAHLKLMERVIQAQQLITIRKPVSAADESRLEEILMVLVQHLAQACDGVIQIDGVGWHDGAGTLLLPEY